MSTHQPFLTTVQGTHRFACMESCMDREAEQQAGRRRSGLCGSGGSGDRPVAPARPSKVLDPSSQHMLPHFFTGARG
jgi:hypothetical protein